MTTLTPLAKASEVQSTPPQFLVDGFFHVSVVEWLPSMLERIREFRRVGLICHLIRHLWGYARIERLLDQDIRLDEIEGTREFVRDAESLAAEIGCLPDFKTAEPLREVHRALTTHWNSIWSTGGVSEIEYRARLKGAILYILDKCQESTSILSPALLIEHLCEPAHCLCGAEEPSDTFLLNGRQGNAPMTTTSANRFVNSRLEVCEGLASADLKDAVTRPWDRQTGGEMEVVELEKLAAARQLFREGSFESAKDLLASPEPKHAESFNLLGLICESEGSFDDARKWYGKARSSDKTCLAAQRNGCRIYELYTFGHSNIPMYL